MKKITAKTSDFILQWGEMASHWGLNRTEAQIHALLFLSPRPLHAQEIAETLSVARSNVSNSIKELQRWGIVKTVRMMGDRRDYFESLKDVWEMFRVLAAERKRREIDPWIVLLKRASEEAGDGSREEAYAKERIAGMRDFFETLAAWHDDTRALPASALKGFFKQAGRAVSLKKP